jgi:N-acetylmuramoyl-L-alanine amidase
MICQLNISHKFKSNNFDNRKNKISFIIIHYTETKTLAKAVKLLTDKERKVSCHYLIDSKGVIFNLVDLNKRAWHAGESRWKNFTDINSRSIGIEIVNSGEIKKEKYKKEQINVLIELIKSLKHKYNIRNEKILGHSDIAPLRKTDPGKFFPWEKLNRYSIGLWANVTTNRSKLTKTEYKNFLFNLKKIGYRYFSSARENKLVIDAFHRHHLITQVGKLPNKSSLEKTKKLLRIKDIDLKE